MTTRTGNISVSTQDIFPIIKKWLYSEHDIFLRELISNSTDAISKRATLARMKNVEVPTGEISLEIDKKNKTLTIIDNGLGMSETEVEKYIAQLAFSGASEFVEKMKSSGELKEDIIGKFGLGFYSVFMVASKVEVESLSWEEKSTPTKWTCDGDTDYEFSSSDKKTIGTSIKIFLNDDSLDFLETYKTRSIVKKYCEFLPYSIKLIDLNEREAITLENLKAEKEEDKKPITDDIVNNTNPLWKKDPATLKDEDYKNFYRELFPFDQEPLFWLHLNVDHPFALQGILYFPKVNKAKPVAENNIKLYSKQVFVSDSVKNIIPEFLGLLKGTIDSTDIPLNVSRSALQGDPNIAKISNYIIKKVSESLKKLFKNEREKYETVWSDISLFVKYGIVSHEKFDEQTRDFALLNTLSGKLMTTEEYALAIPEEFKEKLKGKIVYVEEAHYDSSLAKQLTEKNIPVVVTESYIDPHFMQHLEFNSAADKKVSFSSIDTIFDLLFESEATNDSDNEIKTLFEDVLVPKTNGEENKNYTIELKKLSTNQTPVYLKVDEQSKRFQKMSESMGQGMNMFPLKTTLVINPSHPLIQKVHALWNKEEDDKQLASQICFHLQDLAKMSGPDWNKDNQADFINRSQEIIQKLI